ncbi:MAG: BrnT family toxin [Candidatus Poribacteria bacterium]
MFYEWDDPKAAANQRKHGWAFEDAVEVFGDLQRTIDYDSRYDYGEERWTTVGAVRGRYVMVVYTERDGLRRIISARKAGRHARERYHREI